MVALASECAKLKQELLEVKKEAGKHKKEKPKKKSVTEVRISNPMTDVSSTEQLQQRCSALEEQNMVCFCMVVVVCSATLHNDSCTNYMYLCCATLATRIAGIHIVCALTFPLNNMRSPHSMYTV